MAGRQPSWNQYEAALLLDGLLDVLLNGAKRNEVVRRISRDLRQMAVNQGESIDEIFRNESGIHFQMQSMESAYRGQTIRKPATKLFTEIVALYRTDRATYEKILKEAGEMVNGKPNVEDAFMNYLASQVSPAQLSELYLCYGEIENFCQKIGLLKKPLFEITDIKTVVKVQQTIEQNHAFKNSHRKHHKLFVSAIQHYFKFIRDVYPTQLAQGQEIVTAAKKPATPAKPMKRASDPPGVYTVDFNGNNDVAFTKPIQFSYFDDVKTGFSNWKELYVAVIAELCEDYPKKFHPGMTFSDRSGLPELSRHRTDTMMAPRSVPGTGYVLETNLGASSMVSKIKYLLDRCNIDYENVVITYRKKDSAQHQDSPRSSPVTPKEVAPPPIQETSVTTEERSLYSSVLLAHFQKGFRLGSPLEDKRFRRCYEELHKKELKDDDAKIESIIRRLCIINDNWAFLPDVMLSKELREKLFRYIEKSFADGKEAIYYQALFDTFREDFLDYPIYNANMLKAYLSAVGRDHFYIQKDYISRERFAIADPKAEIRSYLQAAGQPVKFSEISAAHAHLPEEKIREIIHSDRELIRNASETYFHVSIVHFTDAELQSIVNIIKNTIAEKDFISGNELYDAIQRKLPEVIENNASISWYGLRDALRCRLEDRFTFKGNIISPMGNKLSMPDVFADYARQHDSFTTDELHLLAEQLSCGICFDSVYENSLRVSQTQFVSKAHARFNIAETDAAIDRFCPGNYVSLRKITNFAMFPDAGFPWNGFLLEHYAADYSRKYRLLHNGFHRDECLGAIVRRSSGIETFDDLLVDVLVHGDVELKSDPVLQFLVDEGYLSRKRYQAIESLIQQAVARRGRKDA